jgi:asparagine synthase (glutamine-hydrolysing)
MCGIGGVFCRFDRPSAVRLARMSEAIQHRGPDGHGTYINGSVGLVHRRLSIIDLSEAGRQPMCDSSGRYCLVFNGEIYNFRELRAELKCDWSFYSGSDTEVLLAAYAKWGKNCLPRLSGIYAFAIYDRDTDSLMVARDRFGVKPLYLWETPDSIVFCSEIKGLVAYDPAFSHQLDFAGLSEFLYYGVTHGARTLYKGVVQVRPGEYAEIRRGVIHGRKTHDMVDMLKELPSRRGNTGEIWRQLESSVKAQLVADVPLGVLLSGGLDSSAIAAIASERGEKRISTYSVSFTEDRKRSELPKAELVARLFRTEHHEFHVKPEDAMRVVSRLCNIYDGPFSDAASIPLYLLYEQIRGSVKVVLQGDGGDEIFGGYRRYAALEVKRRLGKISGPIYRWMRARGVSDVLLSRRARRFANALFEEDPALQMAYLLTVETRYPSPLRLISPALRKMLRSGDPFQHFREISDNLNGLDEVQRMLWTDCRVILPDVFLPKVDRASMAWGIEARVPLLDEPLALMLMGVPGPEKVAGGQSKYLMRKCLRNVLPEEILRQRKSGFGVPYGDWLRGPLRDLMIDTLLDEGYKGAELFDRPALELCIRNHVSGRVDSSFLLWKMLNLALWVRASNVAI